MNRLTNSIAVLLTISYGGWLAVCGRLTVGFIYSAFTFSFQLAMGFSSLVTMTGARGVPTREAGRLPADVIVVPVGRLCCAPSAKGFVCSATTAKSSAARPATLLLECC